MLYEINDSNDCKKIEEFLKQENIEHDKSFSGFHFTLICDIENLLEAEDYSKYDKETIEFAIQYAYREMWNRYEWCDYNDFLRNLIDEGIEIYSKEKDNLFNKTINIKQDLLGRGQTW